MGGERVNMNQISVILSHFVFKTTQNVDYQHNADFCWLPAQCCFCSDVKLQLWKFWYPHSAVAYTLKYYDPRQPTLFLKKCLKGRGIVFSCRSNHCVAFYSVTISILTTCCVERHSIKLSKSYIVFKSVCPVSQ